MRRDREIREGTFAPRKIAALLGHRAKHAQAPF